MFGVYVHIPYCIQRCGYCDFATYEQSKILPPHEYVEILKQEIISKAHLVPTKQLDTIYFGGGTPSLIPSSLILSLVELFAKLGFKTSPETEMTLEINPATLNKEKMKDYFSAGINRFSVGAQTFNDTQLKKLGREHNSKQTIETLEFLKSYNINYSFDVLFALPNQTLADLEHDLNRIADFQPAHISPYCLTLKEDHFLNKNRPLDEDQIKMFQLIHERLVGLDYHRYEISNYSKKGFESKHNRLYWDDANYWGVGLSAHSYMNFPGWGTRFWNQNSMQDYVPFIQSLKERPWTNFTEFLPKDQFENLEKHQSLTDFCHISLRRTEGINTDDLIAKFSSSTANKVLSVLKQKQEEGLLKLDGNQYQLTNEGVHLSNQVFAALTFLANEI